jgi:hypothetical protein
MEPLWLALAVVGAVCGVSVIARHVHLGRLREKLQAHIPPDHYLSPWVDGGVADEFRDYLPSDIPDLVSGLGTDLSGGTQVEAHFDHLRSHIDSATLSSQQIDAAGAGTLSAFLDGLISGGGILHSLSQIDWGVVAAMDFSSRLDLSTYGELSQYVSDNVASIEAQDGWYWRLYGYVGERGVADILEGQGHDVEFPDSPTQEGWDILVDGKPYQIKVGDDPSAIREHLREHPDISVITTEDMGAQFADTDRVIALEGVTRDGIQDSIAETAGAIDGLYDPGLVDFPWFTFARSLVREGHLFVRGETTRRDAAKNLGIDVAAVGLGSVAAKVGGALLVGSLPVVAGAGGVVVLGIVSVGVTLHIGNKVKGRPLGKARVEYEVILRAAASTVDAAIAKEGALAREGIAQQQAAMKSDFNSLTRELGERRDDYIQQIEPVVKAFLATFPTVMEDLLRELVAGRNKVDRLREDLSLKSRVVSAVWPSEACVYLSLWVEWYDSRPLHTAAAAQWASELSSLPTVPEQMDWLTGFAREHPFHHAGFMADVVRTQRHRKNLDLAVEELIGEGTRRAGELRDDRLRIINRDLADGHAKLTKKCQEQGVRIADAAKAVEREKKKLGRHLPGLKDGIAKVRDRFSRSTD